MTADAATAGCGVAYCVSSPRPGGIGANVGVPDLGDPLTSWALTRPFASTPHWR